MPTIGYVQRKTDGSYEGELKTLTVSTRIRLAPVGEKQSEKSPDYRIYAANSAEIGAAWLRRGQQSGKDYVSVLLDDPALPGPIWANLGRAAGQDDDDSFALIWNRPGT